MELCLLGYQVMDAIPSYRNDLVFYVQETLRLMLMELWLAYFLGWLSSYRKHTSESLLNLKEGWRVDGFKIAGQLNQPSIFLSRPIRSPGDKVCSINLLR